ncbi:AMP-binding protein [Nocardiopsis kunsanensis]|uniref:AMP-binding protein n=1 Tax=Nocardiopsis kunsanensis TaxID=141693 RepID=A0A919CL87_9ACTN|nr:AMP-binding protein [Nocardiopsis kunsanensis]GHD35697.1 hypothetical protein GCM10007147_42380 [Nocardiopsis kunsanensis]
MTAQIFREKDESAARAIADTSTVGQQLQLAVEAWPNLVIHDDEASMTFAEMWKTLGEVRDGLTGQAEGHPCIIRPENSLRGVAQILAFFVADLQPVILVPSAADPDLAYLQAAMDAGDVPPDTALFLTTGGTTGRPKIIPRTHSSYLQTAWLCSRNAGLDEHDFYLTPLSIAHNYALACPGILGALLFGASFRVTRGNSYSETLESIRRHGATVLPFVPSMPRQWSGHEGNRVDTVRLVQVGGSPVSATDVTTLQRLFSCQVQTSFGMAEGLLAQSTLEDDDDMRLSGIGRMLSENDEYRIVDPAENGAGSLEVRGPYTIHGYIAPDEVNEEKFTPDGWLRTGDLAAPVDQRRLRVLSRADEMINRSGELIDPSAVEALVASHPGVRGIAVLGRPHPLFESIVQAMVELSPGTSVDEVMRWLRATYEGATTLPDSIRQIESIPRTAMGKTDLTSLRTMLGIPGPTLERE